MEFLRYFNKTEGSNSLKVYLGNFFAYITLDLQVVQSSLQILIALGTIIFTAVKIHVEILNHKKNKKDGKY